MKFLKSVLFIALSAVIGYLIWLFFYWLTPYVMLLKWYWLLLILLVLGGLLIPIIGVLPAIFTMLTYKLKSGNIVEKIIVFLILLFFFVSSFRVIWTFPDKTIFGAIFETLNVFWIFYLLVVSSVFTNKDE